MNSAFSFFTSKELKPAGWMRRQLELQVVSAVQDPARVGWFSSIDPEIISAIQNFDYTLFGLDMGLIPKTKVTIQRIAPMGDPMEIRLRGYELTLRKEDASKIELQPEVTI